MQHKLLLDQNISRRVLKPISTVFEGSDHVVLAGLENKLDKEIFDFARAQSFAAVVTNDIDFVALSLRYNTPKVILIKTGNLTNNEVVELLLLKQDSIRAFLGNDEYAILELFKG